MIQRTVKKVLDAAVTNQVLAEKDRAIVEYGLNWAITCFGSLIGFALLGFIVGVPQLIMIGAVVGGLFRFVSGGAHLSRAMDCFLFSAIILLLSGFLAKHSAVFVNEFEPLWKAGIVALILAIGLFVGIRIIDAYAPAANEKRPISDPEERQRLKYFSLILAFLILMAFIVSVFLFSRFDIGIMLMFTFWFQLFSLTPVGFNMFARISKCFGKIRK